MSCLRIASPGQRERQRCLVADQFRFAEKIMQRVRKSENPDARR
jgi:hypothetical protein